MNMWTRILAVVTVCVAVGLFFSKMADAQESTITNVVTQSGNVYEIVPGGVETGQLVYVDRPYTIGAVPEVLQETTLVRGFNGDKTQSGPAIVTFEVGQPVAVYVAHDIRVTEKPAWMGGWVSTHQMLNTGDATFEVFSKSFEGGLVVLGQNSPTSSPEYSMYVVAVEEVVGATPPPPFAMMNFWVDAGGGTQDCSFAELTSVADIVFGVIQMQVFPYENLLLMASVVPSNPESVKVYVFWDPIAGGPLPTYYWFDRDGDGSVDVIMQDTLQDTTCQGMVLDWERSAPFQIPYG